MRVNPARAKSIPLPGCGPNFSKDQISFESSAASEDNRIGWQEMYRCQICQQCVPARTKAYRLPVETRHRHYPPRLKANPISFEGKVKYTDDPGGEGYEIAREVTACPTCATAFNQRSIK